MKNQRFISIWLASICVCIITMIVVGGVTRLTHSGLSMVEWKPITGAIPPLKDSDWQALFDSYKQYPEYQLINQGMTLAQFKRIFFWEYVHRLIARLIGLIVFLPWLYLIVKKQMPRTLMMKTIFGFLLGGLQGLMGWLMVASGLKDNPHVSHYRLAAHLLLALFILSYFLWLFLEQIHIANSNRFFVVHAKKWPLRVLSGIVVLQIFFGALTAGLKAGFMYPTFPFMSNHLIPSALLSFDFTWVDLLEDPTLVQFVHRTIAWSLLLFIPTCVFYYLRNNNNRTSVIFLYSLIGILCVQFLLGVWTVLWHVPVAIATFHQLIACLLLANMVTLNFFLTKTKTQSTHI